MLTTTQIKTVTTTPAAEFKLPRSGFDDSIVSKLVFTGWRLGESVGTVGGCTVRVRIYFDRSTQRFVVGTRRSKPSGLAHYTAESKPDGWRPAAAVPAELTVNDLIVRAFGA